MVFVVGGSWMVRTAPGSRERRQGPPSWLAGARAPSWVPWRDRRVQWVPYPPSWRHGATEPSCPWEWSILCCVNDRGMLCAVGFCLFAKAQCVQDSLSKLVLYAACIFHHDVGGQIGPGDVNDPSDHGEARKIAGVRVTQSEFIMRLVHP